MSEARKLEWDPRERRRRWLRIVENGERHRCGGCAGGVEGTAGSAGMDVDFFLTRRRCVIEISILLAFRVQ